MLVAMAGLPGTGKSALAYRLAEALRRRAQQGPRSAASPERYVSTPRRRTTSA
ncbi:MAG: hypothetical protein WKH64_18200 [Chloroflexia bacterium]